MLLLYEFLLNITSQPLSGLFLQILVLNLWPPPRWPKRLRPGNKSCRVYHALTTPTDTHTTSINKHAREWVLSPLQVVLYFIGPLSSFYGSIAITIKWTALLVNNVIKKAIIRVLVRRQWFLSTHHLLVFNCAARDHINQYTPNCVSVRQQRRYKLYKLRRVSFNTIYTTSHRYI
jgi:hypothetical protein